MEHDNALERRRAREAASDAATDLILKALTAFLTGKAHISVESDGETRRKISFVLPE